MYRQIVVWLVLLLLLCSGLGVAVAYHVGIAKSRALLDGNLVFRNQQLLRFVEMEHSGLSLKQRLSNLIESLDHAQLPIEPELESFEGHAPTPFRIQLWRGDHCVRGLLAPVCQHDTALRLTQSGFDDQQLGGQAWRVHSIYSVKHDVWLQGAYPASLPVSLSRDALERIGLQAWFLILGLAGVVIFGGAYLILRPLRRYTQLMMTSSSISDLPQGGWPKELDRLHQGILLQKRRSDDRQRQQLNWSRHTVAKLQSSVAKLERAIADGELGSVRAQYLLEKIRRQLQLRQLTMALEEGKHEASEPLSLADELAACIRRARPLAKKRQLMIELQDCSGLGPVELPPAVLQVVLDSVLESVFRHSLRGERVVIAVTPQGEHLKLTFATPRPGAGSAVRPDWGSSEQGSAIGSSVRRLAQAYGVNLGGAEPRANVGAQQTLLLPRYQG
ncbi:hypothetical protein [Ferrimonas gelatinilytica]|uniref:Signal transduction histidine kinase subgroup 3 dimerisation and phosphoacceptor domain-containing protein n=1 Tax=Ferrimonas gelatinilytica TaxID=1255257 RepID=A0ABP9S9M5_9GAMM